MSVSRRHLLLATGGVAVVGSAAVAADLLLRRRTWSPQVKPSEIVPWSPDQGRVGRSLGQELPAPPEGWSPGGVALSQPPPVELPSGRNQPTDSAFTIATAVMQCAPYACRPIEVAQYFEDITMQGSALQTIRSAVDPSLRWMVGAQWASEWEGFYNPVIIDLFRATRTDPLAAWASGDQTPWCAAFVNWCIARSQLSAPTHEYGRKYSLTIREKGTLNASSGSFRCWGEQTDEPTPGDVVVFATTSNTVDCAVEPNERVGRGHVGFYLGEDDEGIHVLGGNQRNPITRTDSVVFTQVIRRSRPSSKLHSFRTVDGLT